MRLKYIDYIKGFAILCMLLSHCMDNIANYRIGIWITSFNMPIFFVTAGVLIQMKYTEYSPNRENTKALFLRRIIQLGIPYYIFSFLLSMFYCALSALSNHTVNFL